MTDPSDSTPTVLVVDDERDLADLYAAWLEDEYNVLTAYGGEEALEQFDGSVDVVLLDRRMPDVPGDDVLTTIRDRGSDCQVVMVTAVEPDFDILEMGFDGYLNKPAGKDDLQEVIERMLSRREYGQRLRTYYRLVAKRTALQAEKTESELADSDEFAELQERIAELESDIDTALEGFDDDDFDAAFRELEGS